jgi:hypothetical protein
MLTGPLLLPACRATSLGGLPGQHTCRTRLHLWDVAAVPHHGSQVRWRGWWAGEGAGCCALVAVRWRRAGVGLVLLQQVAFIPAAPPPRTAACTCSGRSCPCCRLPDGREGAELFVAGIRAFGFHFFACKQCAQHFQVGRRLVWRWSAGAARAAGIGARLLSVPRASSADAWRPCDTAIGTMDACALQGILSRPEFSSLASKDEAALWVWRVHNEASSMLTRSAPRPGTHKIPPHPPASLRWSQDATLLSLAGRAPGPRPTCPACPHPPCVVRR